MEKPTNNYEFNVVSRHYLINLPDRTTLMTANKVITKDGNVYTNGIFNHGIFNHGIFNHGIFNHGIFNHGIFNQK